MGAREQSRDSFLGGGSALMKKNIVLLASVTASVLLAACQFQAGTGPQTPTGTPTPGAATPAAPGAIPSPAPVAPSTRVMNMQKVGAALALKTGKLKDRFGSGGTAPTAPTTPTAPGTTPTPPAGGEPPVIVGPTPFGSGDPKDANFLGSVYDIPPNSDKLPDLSALKAVGTLFAKELNVPTRSFTDGFPGISKKSEWFAIRFEAPLTVETEGDYDLTTISDDGSIVYVDDTKIVDNDGIHAATEKTGPVHLVKGTHSLKIDYYQGPADQIALQFYCNKMGGAKAICTGKL